MKKNDYITHFESPSVTEFINLRTLIGWGETDNAVADTSLNNS